MKKIFFVFVLFAVFISLNAQQQGKVRGGLDIGLAASKNSRAGLAGGLELKYNVLDNWNLGTRLDMISIIKDIENNKSSVSSSVGLLIVSDYYFNNGKSSFAPFVGGGIGYYGLAGVEVDRDNVGKKIDSDLISSTNKMGGLVRIGFEASRFRATIGYNMIPDATYTDKNNKQFTTTNNHYSITIGFYIGGGKWKK